MVEINLRGELWDNDSADILRWMGWRDLTAPMDVQAALERAGGDDVTVLINSPGGDLTVGGEIRSMLRRYPGRTTALYQGYGASAATVAAAGCGRIQSEPGALLCYHNPSAHAEGDFHALQRAADGMENTRDGLLEIYLARPGIQLSREELTALMDRDIWINPTQALEYGLIDEIAGAEDGEGDPAPYVAAAGRRMRLTAAMREAYAQHMAQAARAETARRVLAKAKALAAY